RMLIDVALGEGQHVADGKDPGCLEVRLLLSLEVGEEPPYSWVTVLDRGDHVGLDHRVQLTGREHGVEVVAALERLKGDAGRRFWPVGPNREPFDLGEIDLVVMLQRAPGPHIAAVAPAWDPD